MSTLSQAADIISRYNLTRHPEGGWFSEEYTSHVGTVQDERQLAGSIYFLLDRRDISHFHEIDCDEIWYYHEGCGLKLWLVLPDGTAEVRLLGIDASKEQAPMVIIPKGTVFAAENTDPEGFTFLSCLTTPKFRYSGFRLVSRAEFLERFPSLWNMAESLFL